MDQLVTNGALNDKISTNLTAKLQHSHSVFEKAFKHYDKKQVFLSFNGGKDCTVLLHLLSEHLKDKMSELKVIYFRAADPFPEIEEFVKYCETFYKIEIDSVESNSMKEVLTGICKNDQDIKACIMGSRRTDPYCDNLGSFQPTDRGWPELMRINPMLDWTCEDVWEYLLKNKVPYCSLYERGYTSIGNVRNTKPNPHLEVLDRPGTFLPAYKLLDDSLERAGRN